MNILVLEASTTSAKAMLFHAGTGDLRIADRAYPPMHPDGVLHDAETVFQAMAELGRDLADGQPVELVSLVGAWHSVLLCDREMNPITPVYPWTYTGAAERCGKLRQNPSYVDSYYHSTGCMVNATYPFFKLLHLREQGHSLKDSLVAGQGSYNTYRLTGQRVVSPSMVSGAGMLNVHTENYDPFVLSQAGITTDHLARLVPSRETFPLSEEGARLLGLREGVPVIPSNPDGGLNQIGSGAVEQGVMTLSVGTSGALRLTTGEPRIPDKPSTWCYLSPAGWLSGAATAGCCNCLDWFRNQLAGGASHRELESDGALADTPVFLPFLFGERCPGWEDRRAGGFFGLKPHHGLGELYRAVQEGVLFNLYQCYRHVADFNGEPSSIKLSGGILHSPVWTQLCADIFGRELEVDEVRHGSLLGGAHLALEVLELNPALLHRPRPDAAVIRPDRNNADLYWEKYHRYLEHYRGGR